MSSRLLSYVYPLSDPHSWSSLCRRLTMPQYNLFEIAASTTDYCCQADYLAHNGDDSQSRITPIWDSGTVDTSEGYE